MNILPIAVVLGGTLPHKALITNLKKRGYYTLLIDYYENPPAREFADEHLQLSTLDKEAVLEISRSRSAELVISTCIDQANVTACYVAQKLGLPAPYSYETSLAVTNKGLMKDMMIKSGVPTSKYIIAKDISGFEFAGLNFPVAVKPTDSNSSKGVRKARNLDELIRYFDEALKISRSDDAIIEEYKEGREIGIDCFIKDNEAFVVMTKERRKVVIREKDDPIQQIYGCIWPADLSEKNLTECQQIANKIAQAFGLNNTPLMIQAIVNDDQINVIEFGARIGGGESFRIIPLITGFDVIDAAVDSFLGIPVNLRYKQPEIYYAESFIYAKKGLFGSIVGCDKLLQFGVIEYLDANKTKNMVIGGELSSNNRVGVFAVKSKDKNGLYEKINTAIEKLEVFDIHGNPIMNKDIY
ncbi:MAG: ATP-grasp domain-containing protein [Deltaproteobacteria bacterium]|nr:ATP-grasp domain-containing protein [Deltaproteobacteria bacterium]